MKEQKYKFKASDFYFLLESQEYKCPLSGRQLTPENTTASHILPIRRGGEHSLANIYLVIDLVASLKRNMTDEDLIALCADVLNTAGGRYGFKVSKVRRKGRR